MLALPLATLATGCGGSSGDLTGTTGAVTLLDVQTQVFTPRCANSGCHVGTTAPFGLDLSSVATSSATLIDVASVEVPGFNRVDPHNAVDSYVTMKVTGDPRILGDPMPLSGGPLSDGDLLLITTWINDGAR